MLGVELSRPVTLAAMVARPALCRSEVLQQARIRLALRAWQQPIALGKFVANHQTGSDGMISSERLYPIRRSAVAACAGAAVAILGGLIGLGGAEFRLPILIAIFALYPHRAIRINLLISLATLAMSAVSRLSFVHAPSVADYRLEVIGMLAGGIVAAWLGAGYLERIPKNRIILGHNFGGPAQGPLPLGTFSHVPITGRRG